MGICLVAEVCLAERPKLRGPKSHEGEGLEISGAMQFSRLTIDSNAQISGTLVTKQGWKATAAFSPIKLRSSLFLGVYGEYVRLEYLAPNGVSLSGAYINNYEAGLITKWNPKSARVALRLGYGQQVGAVDDVILTLKGVYLPKASLAGELFLIDEKEARFGLGGSGRWFFGGGDSASGFRFRQGYGYSVQIRLEQGERVRFSIFSYFSVDSLLTNLGGQVETSLGSGLSLNIPF